MKENRDWITETLDHLDPALIEDMDGQTKAKRRPAPVRVLMAAACICALLVTAAMAAEAMGFDFVMLFHKGEEKTFTYVIHGSDELLEGSSIFEIDGSGIMERIPLNELSPALQELGEKRKDEDWYGEERFFASWAEAEEFLGRKLAYNAALEEFLSNEIAEDAAAINTMPGWTPRMPYTRWNGDKLVQSGRCLLDASFKYGELNSVTISAVYTMPLSDGKKKTLCVDADFYVGEGPLQSPIWAFSSNNGLWSVDGQENYLTANKLESAIIDVKVVRDGNVTQDGCYQAFFFLRGSRFHLKAHYSGPEEQEATLAGLKEVLDNFQ